MSTEGKVKLKDTELGFPMPVAVLGTEINGKPSFMTVAWLTRVNFKPPMMGIGVGRSHATYEAIKTAGTFSLSFPSLDQRVEADYVGITSAKKTDKSGVFPVFNGELAAAPMVESCPLAMECRVVEALDLPTNTLFVGEVVGAWADEAVLEDGKVDLARARPLLLSMTDNRYWSLGEPVGQAWRDGRSFQPR
jgi:flavin reductase (DIM6/NTAB) family NADH-FMN oxidoreductase RutF